MRAATEAWLKDAQDEFEAVFLNSIYKGRYPTGQGLLPHGEPEAEDAEKAIAAARSLIRNDKQGEF